MKSVLIYTCVTNNYDWILPPVWRSPRVHYVCFTDNPKVTARGWEMQPLPKVAGVSNGTLANRFCKFFPWKILPEHDWSLYIDANIRLMRDPSPIFAEMNVLGIELAIPKHPHRLTIWQEAEACKRRGKLPSSDYPILAEQLARYKASGFPSDTGLTENNIIFRSGDSVHLMPVMEQWWEELKNGVQRDQLSLPYVLWLTATPVFRLPFSARDDNPYFRIVPHRRNRSLYKYLHARRYHGAIWAVAFQLLRMVRALRRRVLNIFRNPGAH